MDLLFSTYSDLYAARSLGRVLSEPTNHFVRLTRVFSEEQRTVLIRRAFEFYKTVEPGCYSLAQFCAFVLGSFDFNQPIAEDDEREYFDWKNPAAVNFERDPEFDVKGVVQDVCNGKDIRNIATVLARTLFRRDALEELLLPTLASTLGDAINAPAIAAAVEQCLLFNRRLINTYRSEASEIVGFAKSIPSEEFWDYVPQQSSASMYDYETNSWLITEPEFSDPAYNPNEFFELTETVENLATSASLNGLDQLMHDVEGKLDLANRYGFIKTQSGLFIPRTFTKTVGPDFDKIVANVSQDRANLLNLTPRGFEEFMAQLFERLGYEVELTKATRDGGVDLICLKKVIGNPFRLAVEVKRYRENRPISINLVRSFVGANTQAKADRLVFVTTSSYTAPALDFAETYASHFLTLAGYEQIHEWCESANKEQWTLLKS
ncbi:MAG TPA: restriction endonuclease [Chthoniobacterales bacterium]|nr:restriction endonuclease [Chthoniobacterales bacterium]